MFLAHVRQPPLLPAQNALRRRALQECPVVRDLQSVPAQEQSVPDVDGSSAVAHGEGGRRLEAERAPADAVPDLGEAAPSSGSFGAPRERLKYREIVQNMMAVRIVITTAVTVAIGGLGAWAIVGAITGPILEPRVQMTSLEFSPGTCEGDYVLWFRAGEHRTVMATFVLTNEGLSAGEATVYFTLDGAKVDEAKFSIGAGQMETKTWRFRVDDCRGHLYGAYSVTSGGSSGFQAASCDPRPKGTALIPSGLSLYT